MANTIKIKNSGTASNTPSANSLEYGELAINYVDGKLYFKNTASTVNFFSAGAGGGGGASALDDLTDVTVTSPQAGEFLKYNGSLWVSDVIDLGTDTTGNYMSGISGTSPVSVSHTPSEGSSATVSLATGYGDTQNPYNSKAANLVLAGPTTGASSAPSFRSLVADDIPTLNQNTTGSAAKWTTSRTITLSGDLTGNVSIDGSTDVILTATVAANSVALGTDTTGNYMTDVSAGTGISITHTPAEGSTATIAVNTSYAGFVPTGSVFEYAGNTAPTGYLICDGAAVSRTTYAALFAIVGTRYGAGDGTTTFNLPSMATKVPQGITTGLPSGTTLATGAQSADHTHTITTGGQSVDHTHNGTSGTQSADHTHNGTSGNASANHSHNSNWTVTVGYDSVNHTHGYQKSNGSNSSATTGGIDNSHQHTWNANLTTGGDGASHTHNTTTGGMSANHTHNTTTGGVSAGHTHSGTTAGVSVGHTHSFDIVQFVYIIKI